MLGCQILAAGAEGDRTSDSCTNASYGTSRLAVGISNLKGFLISNLYHLHIHVHIAYGMGPFGGLRGHYSNSLISNLTSDLKFVAQMIYDTTFVLNVWAFVHSFSKKMKKTTIPALQQVKTD